MTLRRIAVLPLSVAAVAALGCGPKAQANDGAGGPAGARRGAPKGGPGGAGGAGSGGRERPVVLGPADVLEVQRGAIEASIGIQGNLVPIEQIDVRARMEGNLVSVSAREGTPVHAGQVLARFDDATAGGDQASANADVESTKSEVANAQWNADQSADLFKAGAIAERDLRTAQAALAAAKARAAAAEARLKGATQTFSDTRVVAPTTGVVSVRNVETGEHVQRGAVLFTVVRSAILELEGSVPARRADEVATGQVVRFSSDGRNFTGRVARVNPAINPASRALTFYVEVPNANGALKANAFATGRVVGRSVPNATLVPTSAVRQNPSGGDPRPYVYAIVNGAIERRVVTPGIVDDLAGVTQVVEGLEAGDRIVAGNITTVGNGQKVSLVTNDRGGAGREVAPGGAGGRRPGGARTGSGGGRGRGADSAAGPGGRPTPPDSSARRR